LSTNARVLEHEPLCLDGQELELHMKFK